jgi:hypothetical protein
VRRLSEHQFGRRVQPGDRTIRRAATHHPIGTLAKLVPWKRIRYEKDARCDRLWGMATIGRPKAALVVTEDERTELVRLTKRAHVNRLLAFRARLVLACADGATDTTVARRQRTTKTTVGKGRRRFIASRLDGLLMSPGSEDHGRFPTRTSRP